jgi:phosphoglucosamine mutase
VRTIRRLGAGLVRALRQALGVARAPRFLIGRDTRESGPWIEREIAHGAASEAATIVSAGVIPTPAIAYLTRTEGFDAGLMISASHNPFADNGIKMFSGAVKFTERPAEVSGRSLTRHGKCPGEAAPVRQDDLSAPYLTHVRQVFPDLDRYGARIAVGARTARATVAARVFAAAGMTRPFSPINRTAATSI